MPVTVTLDRTSALVEQITALIHRKVLIGIPAENAQRDDDSPINNAQIGYINEFGLPKSGIPARPHLVPGVTAIAPRAIERLKKAAEAALDEVRRDPRPAAQLDQHQATLTEMKDRGKRISKVADPITKQLNAVGIEAVASVKGMITAGLSPPLAATTLAERARRGFAGTKPLIVTSDYLRHINYVIRKV